MIDPVKLSRELIRLPSITPNDAGCIDLLISYLQPIGFICEKMIFDDVTNLYARYGVSQPNFCFAGHIDVVPEGELSKWQYPPFAAMVVEQKLYGRGAVDMKSAIACFISAVEQFISGQQNFPGSISFIITGDEEDIAINGTVKVLEVLSLRNEKIDSCIVGEPTNPEYLGQMVKIGRRGSACFNLTVHGIQGHIAYPALADNPVTKLIHILEVLTNHNLDEGTEFFDPSNLEVSNIQVGNPTRNLIPCKANCFFNIRFNNLHDQDSLSKWVREVCEEFSDDFELELVSLADCFFTEPGNLTTICVRAIEDVLHIKPKLSTTGGTSDARFIKNYAEVVEFGLINQTAHKVDEYVLIEDIDKLTKIYHQLISSYFHKNNFTIMT